MSTETLRILVTGASGKLGRHLCRHIDRRGHRIIGFDRQKPDSAPEWETNVVADISDEEALRDALEGVDGVVHLAGISVPSGGTPAEIFDTNIRGTFRLYEACAHAGIESVVAAGSINAVGVYFGVVSSEGYRYLPLSEDHPSEPSDPYSFSKRLIEEIGSYSFRRHRIGGACLRIPVCFAYAEPRRSEIITQLRLARGAYLQTRDLGSDEWNSWYRRFCYRIDRYRTERAREREADPLLYMSAEEYALYIWAWNLLCVLEVEDLADAALRVLRRPRQYFGPIHLGGSTNVLGVESREFARHLFPAATTSQALEARASLVSNERARKLLGWRPEHTDRALGDIHISVIQPSR